MLEGNYSLLIGLFIVLYTSGVVSHFFSTLAVQNVTKSLECLIKSPRARKDLKELLDETKLQSKLSPVWPYALYLIIKKK